jgi:copper chaperone
MEKTYQVDGMTCGGCTASVTKALERAFPEASIAVSLEDGTATVRGEHDEARARDAIEDAGFDVAA